MNRVAVTGIGVISPLGNTQAEVLGNAIAGRSAIRKIDEIWCKRLVSPIAARVHCSPDEHFAAPKLRMLDRVSQLAVMAARLAIGDAGYDIANADKDRIGIFVGTGMGGWQSTDEGYQTLYAEQSNRIRPFTVLMSMANAPAAWIGIEYGVTGPNLTYSTACSSSAVSIGEAWMRLRNGDIGVAIAGGAEAPLSFGSMKAWEALHTIASVDPTDAATSCKPFSRDRSGMVLGEGAAIVVLEEWEHATKRGARIHGELIGYGIVTDATHITRPTISGQAAAMRAALRSAGCVPTSIDTINAHGTGTEANDSIETAAIKEVFGQRAYRIPISATKAIHGHLLGASAAFELALSLLAAQRGVLLPTMHLQLAAADCDLDYVPNCARYNARTNIVMSNSFAFGGTNAVLITQSSTTMSPLASSG